MAPVAKAGYLEKLPSSQVKWGTSGWKKRHLVAKSAGGQGNMAHPNMVAWHEKEGKPQAGFLELTPGSTLVVLEPEKGFFLRTYDADQLWIRVPPGTANLAAEHASWAEALTNLIAGLAPVAGDDGGPIKDRLVPASK